MDIRRKAKGVTQCNSTKIEANLSLKSICKDAEVMVLKQNQQHGYNYAHYKLQIKYCGLQKVHLTDIKTAGKNTVIALGESFIQVSSYFDSTSRTFEIKDILYSTEIPSKIPEIQVSMNQCQNIVTLKIILSFQSLMWYSSK